VTAVVAVNGLIAEAWIIRQQQASPHITSAFSASLRFVLHQGYLSIAAGLLIGLHLVGFGLYNQSSSTTQCRLESGYYSRQCPE